ncbi:hypothetical protein K493DRAFT_295369 [Basidiobolus meristosporus CBS 931.73]|uniref:Endosome-associated-trafficking regulator 1 n=1 Tax=Basidiobolus meristosporus CBS 931.73 TaxID=1314790 RepID=A0A1Y1ZD36_9FUNG|nr:hypothetical protein K493DRAFT_295369 [Basidiobolus meristosporus CBS 931.73]|eukprot:ORY07735.1 hypothetical protein K493DRAFT_295369 [Basidiobolus meristosporus CBS 931.73]
MLQEPMNRDSFSPKSPLSPYPRPLPKTPLQTLKEGKSKPSPPPKTPIQNGNTVENLVEGPSTATLPSSDGVRDSPQPSLPCDSTSQYLRHVQNPIPEVEERSESDSTPQSSPKKGAYGSPEVKSPSQSRLFSRLSPKPPRSAEPLSPNLTSDEGSPITSPNTSPGILNPQGRIAIKPPGLNGGRRLSKPLPTPRSFSSNIDPKVAELKRQQIQITDLQHQLEVEKEINEKHQDQLLRAEQKNSVLQDRIHQMHQQEEVYMERMREMSKKIDAADRLIQSLKGENSILKEQNEIEREQDNKNIQDQAQYAHLELLRVASMADEGIRMLLSSVQGANNVAQLLNSLGKIQASSDKERDTSGN